MTLLAGVTTGGPGIVLACDSAYRGPMLAPAEPRSKLYPLSVTAPLAAAVGGTALASSARWTVTMRQITEGFRATFDRTDQAAYRVETVARDFTALVYGVLGPLWNPANENHNSFGYVAGFDAKSRTPRLFWFVILPGKGVTELVAMPAGQVLVSPGATAAHVAARAVTREPRNVEHGSDVLRRVLGKQIDHFTRHPSPDYDAAGPVHVLAIAPGGAPRLADLGGGSCGRRGKTVTFQDGRTATITEGVAP